MKKVIAILLAAVMLLAMAGCGNNPPGEEIPSQPMDVSMAVEYQAQYIRTDGYQEGAQFPKVQIIPSLADLGDYYTTYREIYDLERRDTVYADTTIGFLDACDRYDEAFFKENFLIFVLLEEGSGSIRHAVRGVEQAAEGKLSISIDRKVPEMGTDDMAQWHVILELSREAEISSLNDCQVYLDGELAYNGTDVIEPQPEAVFQVPPKGTLHTPEGSVPLTSAGYDWTVENPDGTATSTIADQASRPIPAERLTPVVISSQYAETVYAPIPDGSGYAPTNSLGYFVKLDWETQPSSVKFTCWPDSLPGEEQAVVSQDNHAFYAGIGGAVYEIAATWSATDYHGTANYYVYIVDSDCDDKESMDHGSVVYRKPVIYLYPETETQVSVELQLDGRLTCTYPAYNGGWHVTAAPDGTLTDTEGQTYNYLYWEGVTDTQWDLSTGFCVRGEDTAAFLEEALPKLGLNRREINEFIVYWLPLMEPNSYNIISFQTDTYTDSAQLQITPAPDTMIRIFMTWMAADAYVDLEPQQITAPERTGFTVVEWGGTEVPAP